MLLSLSLRLHDGTLLQLLGRFLAVFLIGQNRIQPVGLCHLVKNLERVQSVIDYLGGLRQDGLQVS